MKLNKIVGVFFLIAGLTTTAFSQIQPPVKAKNNVFPAGHRSIQYVGRVDFSIPKKPKFWAPGAYIKARFLGTYVEITVLDEVAGGTNHNSISVVVDDGQPVTYRLKEKTNKIKVASKLAEGEHTIIICKNTEAGAGYIELLNIVCEGLVTLPLKDNRKIEFIGNSITAGSGADASLSPCGKGLWYDQHNAYLSYGALVARSLHAQWQLSAVSGIGLMKSCCGMTYTMPQVYDKINQHDNKGSWDYNRYHPDVITVCLGENDGIQDSTAFTSAYVKFIGDLRSRHPKAHIICLNSVMADAKLSPVLKNYITGVVNEVQKNGDKQISHFFFSGTFTSGCDGHPDLKEHQLMAKELSEYIAKIMQWTM